MRAETDRKAGLVEQLVLRRRKISAIGAAVLAMAGGVTSAGSAEKPINLKNAWPNYKMTSQGYFIDGINEFDIDKQGKPKRSVLAFKHLGDGKFEMYNSLPPEDCHTDYYQWRKNYLSYTETSNECGSNDEQVIMSPGIGYMPRLFYPSRGWEMDGTSKETHIDHGKIVCEGNMEWTSKVLGREEVRLGLYAIHTQTNQRTRWTSGNSKFGCVPGDEQSWQENFYVNVGNGLPISGSSTSAPGLVKSEGGNLDRHSWDGTWDWRVNFHSWVKGPQTATNSQIPTLDSVRQK